jgi:peptide/nickel transport system permease protein
VAGFIVRRLLLVIPLGIGVTLVAFFITNTIPADPILTLLGDKTSTENPAAVALYRHQWGFDQPLPVRYLIYLEHVAHGDLGNSIVTRRPVMQDIRDFWPATAELAIFAIAFAIIVGVPLGVVAAVHHGRIADSLARFIALSGSSIPVFWLALVALQIFYVQLKIAPSVGRLDISLDPPQTITGLYTVDSLLTGNMVDFWNALAHLALPSMVLGANIMGLVSRMVRDSLLRTLNSDFVRTARSKGLPERRVIYVHALRNALIPTVTVVGLLFAQLMSGAVLTETTFAWPGLGRYLAKAAMGLDFSAIVSVTLLVALIFILVNLVVDIGYGFLDPRIRYS